MFGGISSPPLTANAGAALTNQRIPTEADTSGARVKYGWA